MMEEIIEALESTAPNRKAGDQFGRTNASARDIRLHRDYLMRFLDELDGGITVGELRNVLEDWQP